MSSKLRCEFFRTATDQWFYALQVWDSPALGDWRKYAAIYGPFVSESDAVAHQSKIWATPSGYHIDRNIDNKDPDEVWARLISRAKKPYETEIKL
jgi:hypothetical protein